MDAFGTQPDSGENRPRVALLPSLSRRDEGALDALGQTFLATRVADGDVEDLLVRGEGNAIPGGYRSLGFTGAEDLARKL